MLDAPAAALDVLDAGCGTGSVVCCCARMRQLSGVDPSPKMPEQAAALAL